MHPNLLGLKAVSTVLLDAAVGNIETNAWTEVVTAANLTKAASYVEVFNSTGSVLYLAQAASGSESTNVLDYTILPGGSSFLIPLEIKNGIRLAVKAVDTAASSGVVVLNMFG